MIQDILEPFRVATKYLEGDNASAGLVIPMTRLLHKNVFRLKNKYNNSPFLEALSKSMDRRLAQYDTLAETSVFRICSFVDPRIKLKWCSGKWIALLHRNVKVTAGYVNVIIPPS